MAEKNKPENSNENEQQEDWGVELTADARKELKSPDEVKDIHKEANQSFFALLKQHIVDSKKLREKLKSEAKKIKEQVRDSLQKIKELYAAMAKRVPYQAQIISVKYGKYLANGLKMCKEWAAKDVTKMKDVLTSGVKSSYSHLVSVIYQKPKQHDIAFRVNQMGSIGKDKDVNKKQPAGVGKELKSQTQVKDIQKKENVEYFSSLKLLIVNSKRLGENLKKAIDVIKQQIADSKKKIDKFRQAVKNNKAYQATVIGVEYATLLVQGLGQRVQRIASDISKMKNIIAGGIKRSYEVLTGVSFKNPQTSKIQTEENEKNKGKQSGQENEETQPISAESQKTASNPATTIVAQDGLVAPENAKVKEVARGVSSVSAIQAEKVQKSEINQDKTAKLQEIGLSRQAEKKLRAEERRQEKAYKKLEQDKDKGITAERTVSSQERTEAEKPKVAKTPERQNQVAEEKRKADEAKHIELTQKIGNLREKLDKLQTKNNDEAKIAALRNGQNAHLEMTDKEISKMPSVKAEKAMQQAEISAVLPEVERGGVINEASLQRMEKAEVKAETGLKQATLVPDYATPEFKQKAAEQGIEVNKAGKIEQKQSDQQKLLALSGRSVPQAENQETMDSQQNQNEQQNDDRPQLRIDPEKSRAMSSENSGKQINMHTYQMQKMARGGRATG